MCPRLMSFFHADLHVLLLNLGDKPVLSVWQEALHEDRLGEA